MNMPSLFPPKSKKTKTKKQLHKTGLQKSLAAHHQKWSLR